MNPQQAPSNSVHQATQPDEHTRRKLLVWGLVCLIVPSVLFIIALLLAAISNLAFSNAVPAGDDLFLTSPAQTAMNILVFALGAMSILTWLPGIIVGIILLVKRQG